MQDRRGFSELLREEQYSLPLPLPPIPRVKADHCRFCHAVHMNVRDFIQCREANT